MSKAYTETEVATIVGTYDTVRDEDYATRTATVEALAKEFDRTVGSVRSKLVAEGRYIAKEKSEAGSTATTTKSKEDVRKAFEAVTGLTLRSLENMTKKDLNAFWDRFVEMSETRNVSEDK